LEYRGYDSAGVAVVDRSQIHLRKRAGKIAELEAVLPLDGANGKRNGHDGLVNGTVGLAHTRWATHGVPNDTNAHPHTDCTGRLVVVHNGIIENFDTLKRMLLGEGHVLRTDTDTEVLAHLIEKFLPGRTLEAAVISALRMVEGTYGLGVLSADHPDTLVGARMGSPLLVAIGDGEHFIASDAAAVREHTAKVVYMDDGEVASVHRDSYRMLNLRNEFVSKPVEEISWDLSLIQKAGHAHFMHKEIFEQPDCIRNALRGRLLVEEGNARLGGLNMTPEELQAIDRLIITACGTSWHAGMIGEYMIEDMARIPVEVEYASEFRYRDPIIRPGTAVIVISQSGETADTLAAMREAQRKGARALGIVNVVGSTIARQSDGGIYIHAGPEIGVASTKAFTSQVATLAVLTLRLGRLGPLSEEDGRRVARELSVIPEKMQRILDADDKVRRIAEAYAHHTNFLYLGRGYNFPVALEGALKLKEISYIHAEGYPAAEMKHGPIALIDEKMPAVIICTKDRAYGKVLNNMEQVRSRGGRIIAIASEGDTHLQTLADHVLYVPETLDLLNPLLTVLPLQLLAYHIAVLRGCDVDQPRNLAKSVTVE
jgi:glucosamine--fructose-6-phosphate aminotransferase (isomerizing)